MSKCTQCLQGVCRKHPLQDHGARAEELRRKALQANVSSIDSLIQNQIEKLKAQSSTSLSDDGDIHEFRSQLDLDRQRARSSAPKLKKEAEQVVAAGLNPSVAALMFKDDDSESTGSSSSGSSGDSDSERSRSKKSGRKRKRSEKKSHKSKKSKKEKKSSKKSKKSKKEKDSKRRKRSSSESSSGCDSSKSS